MHNIEFDYFRSIFISFIIILAILMIFIFLKNSRFKPLDGFLVTGISFFILLVSIYMTYLIGIFADELSMAGDAISFYLFIIITLMTIINIVAFFYIKRSN